MYLFYGRSWTLPAAAAVAGTGRGRFGHAYPDMHIEGRCRNYLVGAGSVLAVDTLALGRRRKGTGEQ